MQTTIVTVDNLSKIDQEIIIDGDSTTLLKKLKAEANAITTNLIVDISQINSNQVHILTKQMNVHRV